MGFLSFLYVGAWAAFVSPRADWLEVTILGALNLIVWAATLSAAYWAANRIGTARRSGVGRIVGHRHEAAYTTTLLVSAGNGVMVPVVQHHPEAWLMAVEVDGLGADWGDFGRDAYRQHRDGDAVDVEYALGRIDGTLAVRSIAPRRGRR